MNRNGFTLMEGMLTIAILGILALSLFRIKAPVMSFFQHGQINQQSTMEARSSLDYMLHALQQARANSVMISTPAGSAVPNSKIDFTLNSALMNGTTAYTFYLANRTIQMQEFVSAGIEPGPQTLAQNVSGLFFTGDSSDASILYVSLRIDPPVDTSGKPTTPLQVLNQEVHLAVNP